MGQVSGLHEMWSSLKFPQKRKVHYWLSLIYRWEDFGPDSLPQFSLYALSLKVIGETGFVAKILGYLCLFLYGQIILHFTFIQDLPFLLCLFSTHNLLIHILSLRRMAIANITFATLNSTALHRRVAKMMRHKWIGCTMTMTVWPEEKKRNILPANSMAHVSR